MLGKYWVPQRENLVTEMENLCVIEALDAGYTVVLDSTNLNPIYLDNWEELCEKEDIEIEYKQFYISLEEAIERDSKRDSPVGEKVIRNFYKKYDGTF